MADPNAGFLSQLYQQDFGRAPDPAGLTYWEQQMAGGVSPTDVQSTFLASPEYQGLHPTGSGTGYQVPGGQKIQDYSAQRAQLQQQIAQVQQQIADVKQQIAAKKAQGWSLPVGGGSGATSGAVTDYGAMGTPTNTSSNVWATLTQPTSTALPSLQQSQMPASASNVAFH